MATTPPQTSRSHPPLNNKEADTIRKARFFEAYDLRGKKPLKEVFLEQGIEDSIGYI